ncbi:proline dehydrogenase, partial [Chloroflexota bacterium]
MLHNIFLKLSASDTARVLITHFGPARYAARRFVAGETLAEAVAVAKALNERGLKTILNEVGESVTTQTEASQAAKSFQELLHRIHIEG